MATDAAGNLSGTSQVVTVTTPIPVPPTISVIPDQTTLVGIAVGPFPFSISDPGVDPSFRDRHRDFLEHEPGAE